MTDVPSEKQPVREIVFMDKPAKPEKPKSDGFPNLDEIRERVQAALNGTTTGRHGPGDTEMSDEKRALFELLEVVHLPEWSPTPVVKMKPDRIQIAQARRLVDALYDDFGVRVNEHLVKKKWVPTPGVGANNPHDMGTFIERNEDGSWPLATPEDFFDPDDITVEQGADGQYVGIHHGSGIVERAKSATHAKLAVSAKLLQRIEEAAETDQAG